MLLHNFWNRLLWRPPSGHVLSDEGQLFGGQPRLVAWHPHEPVLMVALPTEVLQPGRGLLVGQVSFQNFGPDHTDPAPMMCSVIL